MALPAAVLTFLSASPAMAVSDGTLDTAFKSNIGSGGNASVFAVALQSDGKVLIGGAFTSWNGTSANRFSRLNSDGTFDSAFQSNIGTGATTTVYDTVEQSDGKILVAGDMYNWNGTRAGGLVRLNSDGTLDTAYKANTGTGSDGLINSIALQPDGKLVVGGWFTSWNGTSSVGSLVRLNSDGTLDTAFKANTGTGATAALGSPVNSVALQSDGKILVGGNLNRWNANTSINTLVRLNSDGTRDTGFSTNVGTGAGAPANGVPSVYTAAVQSDGKILIAGDFGSWNGTTGLGGVTRLNSDGTLDTAFTANTGTGGAASGQLSESLGVVQLSDGDVLLGGYFTSWNGSSANRVVRLNSDGTLDTAFMTITGTQASSQVYWNSIVEQPDGKILIGGSFSAWNSQSTGRLVRLGNPAAPSLSPASQTVSGTQGSPIAATSAMTPSGFTGSVTYAVSPALPSGLSLSSSTGVISGTPTVASSTTTYTITGTGATSGTATATVAITIAAGPSLSPASQTVSGPPGSAITPTTAFTPTGFTGSVTYAVSPALPSGLTLSSSTGVISGTPTGVSSGTYTITGTGATSGSATATVVITISAGGGGGGGASGGGASAGGGSATDPVSDPGSESNAAVTPSVKPVVLPNLDPIPNQVNANVPAGGVPAGGSVFLVSGQPVPVTVVPNAPRAATGLDVSGPDFTMRLSGRGDDADPLGLGDRS
ncbi:MAG: putative Ig domain-containing protein, partial [Actinomycetales bacterium]|nr:putative Ig domain-containing protein [Actinomycetales bacterium]